MRVAALDRNRELWREVGTDRYYVRERAMDEPTSTSVRDMRVRRYVGRFDSPQAAAAHATAIR